jgi:transcriptional regulator GlxA family with amidase domain
VTLADVALIESANLIATEMRKLARRIEAGEPVVAEYCALAVTLAQIKSALAGALAGKPVTTEALAREIGISSRTLRRRTRTAAGARAPTSRVARPIKWRTAAGA